MVITQRASGKTANFYYLWRALSWVADYAVLFAVPVLMFQETGEISSSGFALFVIWAPRVASLAFAGAFADRWSPRTVLLISNCGRALAAIGAVFAVSVFALSPSLAILIFAFVVGLCFEQAYVAGERVASAVADQVEQPKVQSALTAVEQCAAIFGPLVGGVLLLLEPVGFMLALAGAYAVEAVLTLVVVPATMITSVRENRPGKLLTSSLRIPSFRRLLVVTIGLNFVSALVIGIAPGFTSTVFGMDSAQLGAMFSVASVVSVVAATAAPLLIRKLRLSRFGGAAAVAAVLASMALGLARSLPIYVVLLSMLFAFEALFSVYMRTLRIQIVPQEQYGSSVAVFALLAVAPIPLAGLVLGVLGAWARPEVILLVSALLVLATILALIIAEARAKKGAQ